MIHYLCPCPAGWKSDSRHAVRLARLAVESRIFPLYEIAQGELWSVSATPAPVPVERYLELQGRFKHLSRAQKEEIQRETQARWARLARLSQQERL